MREGTVGGTQKIFWRKEELYGRIWTSDMPGRNATTRQYWSHHVVVVDLAEMVTTCDLRSDLALLPLQVQIQLYNSAFFHKIPVILQLKTLSFSPDSWDHICYSRKKKVSVQDKLAVPFDASFFVTVTFFFLHDIAFFHASLSLPLPLLVALNYSAHTQFTLDISWKLGSISHFFSQWQENHRERGDKKRKISSCIA